MGRYLYTVIGLLSYMGDGTPENPGGDFGMSVWIEAPDEETASRWGKRVLEEFVRQRFRFSRNKADPAAYEGQIETSQEMIDWHSKREIPVCRVGEIPNWPAPWEHDGASGPPVVIER